ncbi:MAG: hypothetical protein NVSMB14_01020 [Isosphaeraceae bacterium]
MDPLVSSLLDLLYELRLREKDIPITVGGGFGLFLKRRDLVDRRVQTLFAELPEPRATNDIDVFFRVDLLTDRASTEALAEAIRRLGYVAVEEAKFYQWKRPIEVAGVMQEVKLDVLVGPLGERRTKLQVNQRRVRPKGKSVDFHAHPTEEALFLEDAPMAIELSGRRSTGEEFKAIVYVPEAFPYLLMKLSAFAERKADENKDLGRHHALDAYTIVGMMTEAEFDRAKTLAVKSRLDPHFVQVCNVVADDFATPTSLGMLRIREHSLFRDQFRLGEFAAILGEIFSP